MKRTKSFLGKVSALFISRVTEPTSPEVISEGVYSYQNTRGEFLQGNGPRSQDLSAGRWENKKAASAFDKQIQLCRS